MARFIVVHSSPEQVSQDEIFGFAKRVAASLPSGIEWRNSWASGAAGKLFCEWEAPDQEAIETTLKAAGGLFPIETIYAVEWIDPEWYK
jgi:hypothetical protein